MLISSNIDWANIYSIIKQVSHNGLHGTMTRNLYNMNFPGHEAAIANIAKIINHTYFTIYAYFINKVLVY